MEPAMDAFVDTLQDFVQNKKALVACVIVMINPLFWNVVSRYEYKTQKLSRTLGGPKRGCATLAACILTLNYVRTATFHKTVDEFGYWEPLHNGMVQALGYPDCDGRIRPRRRQRLEAGVLCQFHGRLFRDFTH